MSNAITSAQTDPLHVAGSDDDDDKKKPLGRVESLASALESKPSNYLFLAIFTIFINPPIAIVALVIAIDSDHQYMSGNTEKARKLGQAVKYLCIVGIGITIILIIVLSTLYKGT